MCETGSERYDATALRSALSPRPYATALFTKLTLCLGWLGSLSTGPTARGTTRLRCVVAAPIATALNLLRVWEDLGLCQPSRQRAALRNFMANTF